MSWHHSFEPDSGNRIVSLAYIEPTSGANRVNLDLGDWETGGVVCTDLTPAEAYELADWIYANVPKPTDAS